MNVYITGVNDVNGFAPSFIEKPRIIPNESGTLITMKCKCKAKPEPTVRWYRGTQLISEGKKLKIKSTMIAEDTFELTLEIQVLKISLLICWLIFQEFYIFIL